jgi:hypothetical protein
MRRRTHTGLARRKENSSSSRQHELITGALIEKEFSAAGVEKVEKKSVVARVHRAEVLNTIVIQLVARIIAAAVEVLKVIWHTRANY